MKTPTTPPGFQDLISTIAESPERIGELLSLGTKPDPNGKYHHWDKLRHLKLPLQISDF